MTIPKHPEAVVNWLHLTCRLTVALTFFFQAANGLMLLGTGEIQFWHPGHFSGASIAILTLLIAVSIWLVFGIYTRIMTVLGGALFVAFMFILGGSVLVQVNETLLLGIVIVASMPLLVFGGGSRAMLKKGWSLPI